MSKQNVKAVRKPETFPGETPENTKVVSHVNPLPDEKAVAELAYRRWVEKGCPQQSAEEDWFEAEQELRPRESNGQ
jgi:hypothetical protein